LPDIAGMQGGAALNCGRVRELAVAEILRRRASTQA
jgi:hypothetical protein